MAKLFLAKVTNLGDTKADGFEWSVESVDFDSAATVEVAEPFAEHCSREGATVTCEFGNVLVRGDSLEIPILVTPTDAEVGRLGELKISVSSPEDPGTAGNNSTTVEVSVSAPGADIIVFAEDVVAGRDDETGEVKRIAPGSEADFYFGMANDGSLTAAGFEFQIKLPERVTFVAGLSGCDLSEADRTLTCKIPDVALEPNHFIEETLKVKVAADAPGPVELTGSMEGKALGVTSDPSTLARRAADAPSWAKTIRSGFDPTEVDNGDNTDSFTVFVAASGGGGLPVTGAATTIMASVGGALVLAGAAFYLVSRRRRILLVTPAE